MIKQYFVTLIVLVALDAIWLMSMKSFYSSQLAGLMSANLKFWPVLVFYILYAFGITVLVIGAAGPGAPLSKLFFTGALLGLMSYGAYDLTNQATLRGWPVIVTIIDIGWGTLLTGLASFASVWIVRFFG